VKEKFLVLIGAHYSDLVELGGVCRSLVAGRLPRGRVRQRPGAGAVPSAVPPGSTAERVKMLPSVTLPLKAGVLADFWGFPSVTF